MRVRFDRRSLPTSNAFLLPLYAVFFGLLSWLLVACATINPPQPPSLELPEPPKDLRGTRKGNAVILEWTVPILTTDRQRLRSLGPTHICRSLDPAMKQCGTPVGRAPAISPVASTTSTRSKLGKRSSTKAPAANSGQKTTATYTDPLPAELQRADPLGFAIYAVEVLNANGRGAGLSNRVQVPLAETLAPPSDFSARVESHGVALAWSAPPEVHSSDPHISYVYRVYRREENKEQSVLAGEIAANAPGNLSFTDSNIEWEQTYYYRVNTATVVRQEGKPELRIEGQDTPEVKVFTHDVFPPAVPTGLQAVFSGPGQQPFIDLVWAPVSDPDLAGYNVYRHEPGSAAVKLNAEPVRTPAYRDTNVTGGREYVYSVSAVDVRGNESAKSEEASERVP